MFYVATTQVIMGKGIKM